MSDQNDGLRSGEDQAKTCRFCGVGWAAAPRTPCVGGSTHLFAGRDAADGPTGTWPRDKGHSCAVPARPISFLGEEASCSLCGRLWHVVGGATRLFWQSKAEGPAAPVSASPQHEAGDEVLVRGRVTAKGAKMVRVVIAVAPPGHPVDDVEFWVRATDLRCASASPPCRRCSECTGESHHWIEHCEPPEVDNGIDTGFAGFVCKHCDARAEMCDDCTGVAEPGHVCEDEEDDGDPPQDSTFVKYRMETFEKSLAKRPLRPLEHSRICREVEEMTEHVWRTAYVAGRRAGVEVAAERLESFAKLLRGLP